MILRTSKMITLLIAILPVCLGTENSNQLLYENIQTLCDTYTNFILGPVLKKCEDDKTLRDRRITDLESFIEVVRTYLNQGDQVLANVRSTPQECSQFKHERDTLKAQNSELSQNLKEKEQNISNLTSKLRNLQAELDKVKHQLKPSFSKCEHNQDYSGLLTTKVQGLTPFNVSCDAGWTVIQRRIDGKTSFYRPWDEYKSGFGDVQREFWLGLEKLHLITSKKRHELYIRMKDQNNEERFARYSNFKIGSNEGNYNLTSIGKYSGTAGNSMRLHEGYPFSTYDRDNDNYNYNCAAKLKGGWWFFACADSNLNGKRFDCNVEASNDLESTGCIFWQSWHGRSHSLSFVEMKIRPTGSD